MKYIEHIENCFKKAEKYESKLSKEILEMDGMSGKKTRHLYNNLCNMDDVRYLEIGTWKGSTLSSAIYNNNITCVAIDNFSEFLVDDIKKIFLSNLKKYKGNNNNIQFIEKNCWTVDITKIGKFNIYMYDGNHDEESHFKALNYYLSCLDKSFIYIVDDWNWEKVRNGTLNSIEKNNLKIIYKKEIFTNNKVHPPDGPGSGDRSRQNGNWHNGISVFILEKSI